MAHVSTCGSVLTCPHVALYSRVHMWLLHTTHNMTCTWALYCVKVHVYTKHWFSAHCTEVVISLDASDGFLKTRVMNLPEKVVAGTHNTEEGTHAHTRTHVHTHTHTHAHTHKHKHIYTHSNAHTSHTYSYSHMLSHTYTHTHSKHTHTNLWGEISTFPSFSSGLLRRLSWFRSQNEDDITVLNYFDELEIHPEHIGMDVCHTYLIVYASPYTPPTPYYIADWV